MKLTDTICRKMYSEWHEVRLMHLWERDTHETAPLYEYDHSSRGRSAVIVSTCVCGISICYQLLSLLVKSSRQAAGDIYQLRHSTGGLREARGWIVGLSRNFSNDFYDAVGRHLSATYMSPPNSCWYELSNGPSKSSPSGIALNCEVKEFAILSMQYF